MLDIRSSTESRLDAFSGSKEVTAKDTLDIFEAEDLAQEANDADHVALRQKEDSTAQQWYDEMNQDGGKGLFYQSWAALTPEMQQYRWPLMAKWHARHTDPEQTWEFIVRTLEDTIPPRNLLQRILHIATKAVPAGVDKSKSTRLANSMFQAYQLSHSRYDSLVFPTLTLRFIASYSDSGIVKTIYEYLTEQGVSLKPSVLFRFAFRFAEHRDPRALELLTRSALSKKSLSSPSVLELCALILSGAKDSTSPTKTKQEVLSGIMELGVALEAPLFNALIQNAIDCDDLETAMRIYSRLAQNSHLRADRSTYLILLPRLRSPENLGWFLEVQRDIRRRGIQSFDPQVVHELMLARYRQTKKFHFELMLGLYEVTFSLQPLKQLGIVSQSYQARRKDYAQEFCGPLPLPTRPIVELMLHIFSHSKPRRVLPMAEVYHNIVRLRNEGIPLFLELARRRSPWTIILKSFCMHETTLKAWPQVIRDMESLPLDEEQQPYVNAWTGMPWQPPSASTPRIWNIIVNGYARRGLVHEAEQILELMSQRHIEPDMFTFTPLLRGYATKQDIHGIENTLRRIEVAGHELVMNDHSMKALSPFEDKEALAKALEESAKRKSDPYTARTADELFESEAEPVIPGSQDEFQRWDSFAQAAKEELADGAKPSKKSARRDIFTQRLQRADQVTERKRTRRSSDSSVNAARLEDVEMDGDDNASWTMDDVEPEGLDLDALEINTVAEATSATLFDSELDHAYQAPVKTDAAASMDANLLDVRSQPAHKGGEGQPDRPAAQSSPRIVWGNRRHFTEQKPVQQFDDDHQWTLDEYLSQANSIKFTKSRGRKTEWFYLERARHLP